MGGRGSKSSNALKEGKTIRVEEQETYRRGDYVETTGWAEFRIKDGKVQVRSNIYKDENWQDHPTFDKKGLLAHLKELKKEGRQITIQGESKKMSIADENKMRTTVKKLADDISKKEGISYVDAMKKAMKQYK